jgi:nucleotide-binding universal stress UspA family protein
MYALRRLLVPVDFSPCSRAALDYAAFLGQRWSAELDVLHVWSPPTPTWEPAAFFVPSDESLIAFERSSAGKAMKEFLRHIEQENRLLVRGRLESGDPTATSLEAAEDGYDLIVMGTHGRTGLSHMLFGSIAEAVVRRAPCPVLTIRAPDTSVELSPKIRPRRGETEQARRLAQAGGGRR